MGKIICCYEFYQRLRRQGCHNSPGTLFFSERREPGPLDVQIDILFCGVCHSDIHTVAQRMGPGRLIPCVPGHEIVGRVTAVGNDVNKFKDGDLAGVGCMVDSCRDCPSCQAGLEQYCENGIDLHLQQPGQDSAAARPTAATPTSIVVDEAFALRVPTSLDLAATAPLLCAGITTYSPLRHWKVGKGQKVGVVGLGGLGHMGVKLAAAMGAEVVALHHLARQDQGRAPPGRARCRASPRTRTQ